MIRLANLTWPHSSRVIQAMAPKKTKMNGLPGGKQLAMTVMFKAAPNSKSASYRTSLRTKTGQEDVIMSLPRSSHHGNGAPALLPSNADVLYGIRLRPGVTACGARRANEQFIQWNELDAEIAEWLRRKTEEIIEITTAT